jgi:hypothetical protein
MRSEDTKRQRALGVVTLDVGDNAKKKGRRKAVPS